MDARKTWLTQKMVSVKQKNNNAKQKRFLQCIHNNKTELVEFIHELRNEATTKGIRATFSYRCITMLTKLEKSGMELKEAMKIAVVKGLDKDTINTFTMIGHSRYHKALQEIKKGC